MGVTVREQLWGSTDPFFGIRPDGSMPRGWGSEDPVFEEVVPRDARLIVEIGSFEGQSALRLAELAPDAEIVCVDTWLGWPDCWTEGGRHTLRLRDGYPRIWESFAGHIVHAGIQERFTPAPMVSHHWWLWARDRGVQPDLVYIDGGHNFRDVSCDIEGAKMLGTPAMFGHDYDDQHPGVKAAVKYQFSGQHEVKGTFWVWRRG